MRTPASRPTSAENIPAAITTTSASMSPRSVRTRSHAAAFRLDAGHAGAREQARSALAGALGQGERQLRGVEVAVGRQPRRAQHALGRHQREQPLGLVGRDQLERQPERLRPARLAAQLLHALLARGQPDAAALDPAAVLAQLAVELDRVHHHLRQRDRAAQLADQPGRVEGGPRRQLVALDQHHVVPAESGEVAGDRRPPDASAHDHAACGGRELPANPHLPLPARCGSAGRRRSR